MHKDISLTKTNYLENTLRIIKHWRVYYYKVLRDRIDSKSWLKHGEGMIIAGREGERGRERERGGEREREGRRESMPDKNKLFGEHF